MSVKDAFNAIRFSHVVVVVTDTAAPLEKQDLGIARRVIPEDTLEGATEVAERSRGG